MESSQLSSSSLSLNDVVCCNNEVRRMILDATTHAQSGHPTSCFSAVELMTILFFGGHLQYDFDNPTNIWNDKVIFSKGHAAPLLYALYVQAGVIDRQALVKGLRSIDSPFEGHPVPGLPWVDVATGSLGQGLSIGLGMAMTIRHHVGDCVSRDVRLPYAFVLMGDSEVAEGQIWEAAQLASHYKVSNLVGILDVNRLGLAGETMVGWDVEVYQERFESFGWTTVVIEDGHDVVSLDRAYHNVLSYDRSFGEKPTVIIAKTVKGKGLAYFEDKTGWNGKVLPQNILEQQRENIPRCRDGDIAFSVRLPLIHESVSTNDTFKSRAFRVKKYEKDSLLATRRAYGDFIVEIADKEQSLVVLDAELCPSTCTCDFKNAYPERFFEMFVAEQNMISCALGMAKLGHRPFVSTFGAFLTRAFDQIRMAQHSQASLCLVGTHAGCSIGEDGCSQMALEDMAMFSSLRESLILYPSDGNSTKKLVERTLECQGISYLRLTRSKTPIIYSGDETFFIGGSHVVRDAEDASVLIVAAGITLHEAIKAHHILRERSIGSVVIDAYSIRPLDTTTICTYAKRVQHVIIVEDHHPIGGLGTAVREVLLSGLIDGIISLETLKHIDHLCVRIPPHSGKPTDLLSYHGIDASSIVNAVEQYG